MRMLPALAGVTLLAALSACAERSSPTDTHAPATGARPQVSEEPLDAPQGARGGDGTVETLRQPHMSSPNVRGETVPENPATGTPEPWARGDPKQLESVPRP